MKIADVNFPGAKPPRGRKLAQLVSGSDKGGWRHAKLVHPQACEGHTVKRDPWKICPIAPASRVRVLEPVSAKL